MSGAIGASGSGSALQRSNPFLDLPEGVLEVVLSYLPPREGARLMYTQKALQGRVLEILVDNQIKYFKCLCEKISSYFLFATEEYRQDVATKGKKIEKEWRETLYKDFKRLTLNGLGKLSYSFGATIFTGSVKEKQNIDGMQWSVFDKKETFLAY